MTVPNWETQFAELSQRGWSMREGQANLGNAITEALNTKGNVIAEAETGTGKSLAAAIPIIHRIKEARKEFQAYRAVISTETINLQNQIVNKDLPMLHGIYGGFTFKKLMGRSNYLCLAQASQTTIGNASLNSLYTSLEAAKQRLTTGERGDVESVLGRVLEPYEWEVLVGSSDFCGPNECESETCFGTRARAEASVADIVVVNHAILATDVEMKTRSRGLDDRVGMLGDYNAIVIDEGHRLAPVFASQNTEKISDWEIKEMGDIIEAGAQEIQRVEHDQDVRDVMEAIETLHKVISMCIEYYSINIDNWDKSEQALAYKNFIGPTPYQIDIINSFESNVPLMINSVISTLEKSILTWKAIIEDNSYDKKMAKARKALTKAEKMIQLCTILRDSLLSKSGIVNNFGIYGVVIQGWSRRDNTPGASILLEPLDVSPKTKFLWQHTDTAVLMSATLRDPTDKSNPLRFVRSAIGFPDCPEHFIRSPFNHAEQQRIYITDGRYVIDDSEVFSFDELYHLILNTKGRALVLFTSRADLDEAALRLRIKQGQGEFPYQLLVQDKESDKRLLAEEFKRDVSSVLLGTDSFMTGFDAPGETLSLVVLCKFPNPRYSQQMKQKMEYWRGRGFPQYYMREALEKFTQAAGRLIRSEQCRGVFALLDQRSYDPTGKVYKTALLGIQSLGSPVTHDMNVVRSFVE